MLDWNVFSNNVDLQIFGINFHSYLNSNCNPNSNSKLECNHVMITHKIWCNSRTVNLFTYTWLLAISLFNKKQCKDTIYSSILNGCVATKKTASHNSLGSIPLTHQHLN